MKENTSAKPQQMGRGGPMGMAHSVEKPKSFKKSMSKFIKYLAPFYVAIIVSLILAVCGTICSIIGPDLLGDMTNVVYYTYPIDMAQVAYYGIWLISLYGVSFIFNYIQGFIMAKIAVKVGQNMRSQISQKINRLPLKYFDTNSYGDTLSRVTNDVDTISQTLNQSLSSITTSITMLIGIFVMMLTISWELTLVSLVTIPLGMFLITLIIKKSQKYYKQQQQSLGDINGQVEEVFSNHNIVKSFNGLEDEGKKFKVKNQELYRCGYKSQFLGGLMMPIMGFVGNLGFVGVSVVGGLLAINGQIGIGAILSFLIYIRLFNQPLSQIASIASVLQSTAAASERVFTFLGESEIEPECSTPKKLANIKGNVQFNNVQFGYDKNKKIIKNFNANIKAGQKVAIVGPTGAGKTTIVNLLERFYEIDKGHILIDDVSIKDMLRSDTRNMFGMVLQDTWLFEGTIRENLLFGNQNATQEQLDEACKSANIYHYIQTLPNGYDYVLTENTNISQGQRQLMTIARAMIQDAPMLILDEATSSVDTRTEILIQQAMDRLSKGRTSFVIAHRLSTIKNADLILVMNKGNIVESGKHKQLLEKNGAYAKLYNSQFAE